MLLQQQSLQKNPGEHEREREKRARDGFITQDGETSGQRENLSMFSLSGQM